MAQMAVTHLKRLFVGSNPDSISNTLTDGQMEIQDACFLRGLVTASAGVSVGTTLTLSSALFGTGSFDGTSSAETITLSGVVSADKIIPFPYGSSVGTGDTLSAVASSGSFTVYRPEGGTSGLTFAYVVVRAA